MLIAHGELLPSHFQEAMDLSQPDFSSGKIVLEIGNERLVSCGRETYVKFIDTRFFSLRTSGPAVLKAAVTLLTEISRPEYRLIVCRAFARFLWNKELSWITNVLRWLMRYFLVLCLARRPRHAKLVVVDLWDELTIDHRDLWLLKRCDLYFKRELAQNVWTTLQRVQPPHTTYQIATTNLPFLKLTNKFRTFSIGVSVERLARFRDAVTGSLESMTKYHDIFFAGTTVYSTVREEGIRRLLKLRAEGYAVYVPEERISQREFDQALCASWLVWSPEGCGWDCYRHYEACLAGSVPVINYPSTRRYAPLLDGIHCFYYAMEGDDLVQKIKAALVNKARLAEMAQAARKHVLQYHTCEHLGAYILSELQFDLGSEMTIATREQSPATPEPETTEHPRFHANERE